ncbi:MAG: ribonuclease H-like domain-containing protein [Treponema sp.]|nr:ribonuclease H-like domain-containing protein [Treponema sp.]
MPHNLKARLGRIRGQGHTRHSDTSPAPKPAALPPDAPWPGWTEAGFKTLKRTLCRELPFLLPENFPKALAVLVPDFARAGRVPAPGELLFFDLETTGLSGGAGTVAFLAAFGRFSAPGRLPSQIEITQYLLLDYPGEADFVENAIKEFAAAAPPFVVSYNGKSFDSQILKTRCLMSGIMPPPYFHADLLHSARRLWRRQLPDCSQATIETSVLGLDRSGDVPGALAPDIWFSFLRSGSGRELLSVCDHNARDISGLASLLLALAEISNAPLKSRDRFRFDEEALALSWRREMKKGALFFGEAEQKTGGLLLESAARNGCPAASIAMAKTAEWQHGDPALALEYTARALQKAELPRRLREDLEKRHARLLGKTTGLLP